MSAPIPADEPQRLEALARYQILDTPPEPVFDDLARTAARQCKVPIALVSLIDRDRQWFKAKVGVPISETSREHSFCAHAILQRGAFIVPDTLEDARFATNPLVTGPTHLRFYAGTPLVTPDNRAIGTLCVLDHRPHAFEPQQQQCLWHLNAQAMMYLELHRRLVSLQRTIRTSLDVVERSLAEGMIALLRKLSNKIQQASDLHQALQHLLESLGRVSGWPIAAAWLPGPEGNLLEASPAFFLDGARMQALRTQQLARGIAQIDPEEIDRFRLLGERLLFRPGEGMQGRVWLTRQPEKWPPKCSEHSPIMQLRLQLARSAGLKTGYAVPLEIEEQLLAVLVFFSWEERPPYEALLHLLATITGQPAQPTGQPLHFEPCLF